MFYGGSRYSVDEIHHNSGTGEKVPRTANFRFLCQSKNGNNYQSQLAKHCHSVQIVIQVKSKKKKINNL